MKFIISGINILIIIAISACSSQKHSDNSSSYLLSFDINDSIKLDIKAIFNDETLNLFNGTERIQLEDFQFDGTHFKGRFPVFNSYLIGKKLNNQLTGFYIDSSRKEPYPISFTSSEWKNYSLAKTEVTSKYELSFSPDSENKFSGLGVFKTYNENIQATILTETGDFRFLNGKLTGQKFSIGAIDGSHVFTFNGELKGDSIFGNFYSGSHWSTDFHGKINPTFELASPDTLTKVISDDPFDFVLPNELGDSIQFTDHYSNKVTIVQILGSWCPNCMDETRYYVDLKKQFPELEIVGVAFERSEELKKAAFALKRMRKDLNVNYDLLIGGISRKSVASEVFPMLNKVISFPTSIFVDKKGIIRKVHTGFNGPSTGKVYEDYKIETEKFVSNLLAE